MVVIKPEQLANPNSTDLLIGYIRDNILCVNASNLRSIGYLYRNVLYDLMILKEKLDPTLAWRKKDLIEFTINIIHYYGKSHWATNKLISLISFIDE